MKCHDVYIMLFGSEGKDEFYFVDVDLPRSHVSHIQSTSEINLIKILQFGKELKSMNTMLSETRGTNEENDLMLEVR